VCIDLIIFVYKQNIKMRSNIDIVDRLLKEAQKYSKLKRKKDVVNHALDQLIRLHKRQQMKSLFGKVKWEGDLDEMRSV